MIGIFLLSCFVIIGLCVLGHINDGPARRAEARRQGALADEWQRSRQ